MKLRTYTEADVRGRRVLVRADLNVPLAGGAVGDTTRIEESLPNLVALHNFGARVAVISHLGRPKARDAAFTMKPVAAALERLLTQKLRGFAGVHYLTEAVGPEVARALAADWRREIVLLENSRFYPGETKNDPEFARELAQPFEAFVNDAFGTAHRAHATTVGVTQHLKSFAGPLMVKEVEALSRVVERPARPFIVVTGGKKVSDKLPLLRSLCGRAETVLVGGAMVFTLARALGLATGKSLVEEEQIDACREVIADYHESTTRLVLPEDVVVTTDLESAAGMANRTLAEIGEAEMGVDIGEATQDAFAQYLAEAATVFWNGPLGVFERPPFDRGTLAVAKAIAENRSAFSVVGGGESVEAVKKLGFAQAISHLSTGGGASLEFVAGQELPGLAVLAAG